VARGLAAGFFAAEKPKRAPRRTAAAKKPAAKPRATRSRAKKPADPDANGAPASPLEAASEAVRAAVEAAGAGDEAA